MTRVSTRAHTSQLHYLSVYRLLLDVHRALLSIHGDLLSVYWALLNVHKGGKDI